MIFTTSLMSALASVRFFRFSSCVFWPKATQRWYSSSRNYIFIRRFRRCSRISLSQWRCATSSVSSNSQRVLYRSSPIPNCRSFLGKRNKRLTRIYFVEKSSQGSSFREVAINEYGAITDWPEGFFDQSHRQAEEILRAAVAKRKAERGD